MQAPHIDDFENGPLIGTGECGPVYAPRDAADTAVAFKLEKNPEVIWPDEPAKPVEAGFRDWIDRCLTLDPINSPAPMVVVIDGFARVGHDVTTHEKHSRLLDQRRAADDPALVAERARARLQLAEGSLASGDAATAASRLDEMFTNTNCLPESAEQDLRLARNSLLPALLQREPGHPVAPAASRPTSKESSKTLAWVRSTPR